MNGKSIEVYFGKPVKYQCLLAYFQYQCLGPCSFVYLFLFIYLFVYFVGGILNKHTHKSWSNNKVNVCKLNAALEGKTADTKLLKAHGNGRLSIQFNSFS